MTGHSSNKLSCDQALHHLHLISELTTLKKNNFVTNISSDLENCDKKVKVWDHTGTNYFEKQRVASKEQNTRMTRQHPIP